MFFVFFRLISAGPELDLHRNILSQKRLNFAFVLSFRLF